MIAALPSMGLISEPSGDHLWHIFNYVSLNMCGNKWIKMASLLHFTIITL